MAAMALQFAESQSERESLSLRCFAFAENTVWKCRYLPESYLASCASISDAGLVHLLYYRTLVNEDDA